MAMQRSYSGCDQARAGGWAKAEVVPGLGEAGRRGWLFEGRTRRGQWGQGGGVGPAVGQGLTLGPGTPQREAVSELEFILSWGTLLRGGS